MACRKTAGLPKSGPKRPVTKNRSPNNAFFAILTLDGKFFSE
jgi:hypothetical protein